VKDHQSPDRGGETGGNHRKGTRRETCRR